MTTTNLGTLSARLVNAHSFHPTLSLSLPTSSIPSLAGESCEANVLVHLPSGVYYDPFTASNVIIGGRKAQRGTVVSTEDGVELEHAVGWVGRRTRESGRQWWERREEREEVEEVDLQGLLSAALRSKAEEAVGGVVKLSLDQGDRVKVNPASKVEDKRERSTVVIPIAVDDLLNANGAFRLDVPLHIRYHPPSNQPIASTSSLLSLAHAITPTPLLTLYHTLLNQHAPPPPAPAHAQLTLPPPTLFITCPSSTGKHPTTLLPASHAHLKPQLHKVVGGKAVVAQTKNAAGLKLAVPVPEAGWAAAVQAVTLGVVGAAAAGIGWRLWAVLRLVEAVEK